MVAKPSASPIQASLSVRDLGYSYSSLLAVDGLSFQFDRGVLAMLGQNGAGKSTTLRMLAGLAKPGAGSIDIGSPWGTAGYREAIGYLPETLPLYPDRRVAEQLAFAARLYRIESIKQGVERVLAECDLESVASRRCGQLSKGMRQRVGLAQAMIHRPPILLLDEPASGLDPLQQQQLCALIRGYAQNRLVVLSSHNLAQVDELADQVLTIYQGRQTHFGPIRGLDRAQLVELMTGSVNERT